MRTNRIYSINGPVVTVRDSTDFEMLEMVYVGEKRLIGEVIRITAAATTIQVYESTTGLRPGEPVEGTGSPLCVTLGPGILRNIFDGIERPLRAMSEETGAFISVGFAIPALDEETAWDVTVCASVGESLSGGMIYATCPETPLIEHRCMVPPEMDGTVTLKRFYRYDEYIELRAENPTYKPIIIHQTDFDTIRVLGKAVACQCFVE